MKFLDDIKTKLFGEDDSQQYYDDYEYADEEQGSDTTYFGASAPRTQSVDSVAVYTRQGERLDSSSNAIPAATSYYEQDAQYSNQEEQQPLQEFGAPAYEMNRSYAGTVNRTQLDSHLIAQPRKASGKLPPYVLRPVSYEDVQMVLRRVRTNQPVVLALNTTQAQITQRILDFCFGLSCGIDGTVEQLSDKTFLVLPQGVELSKADKDKLAREGVL